MYVNKHQHNRYDFYGFGYMYPWKRGEEQTNQFAVILLLSYMSFIIQ